VVRAGRREEFVSSPDQLFAAWPMVVLVGARTQGQAEWIAAALQDNERATVLGQRTLGMGFVEDAIELDNGDAIEFRSGVLERGTGKSLVSKNRMVEMVQFGNAVRVMPTKSPPKAHEMPAGWHGVQPDQLVTSRKAVETAVETLGELLQPATEAELSTDDNSD
jgi:hypothetical protein